MRDDESKYNRALSNFNMEIRKSATLVWRLFKSPQVPRWLKIIPLISAFYWLNPIDFVPFIGLTPLDDIAAILLGCKLLIELSPQDLVNRLRDEINYGLALDDDDPIIDTTYHLMDDD